MVGFCTSVEWLDWVTLVEMWNVYVRNVMSIHLLSQNSDSEADQQCYLRQQEGGSVGAGCEQD